MSENESEEMTVEEQEMATEEQPIPSQVNPEELLAQLNDFRARFSGSQRKLDEVLREKARLEAELSKIRAKLEEDEKAKMSELERERYEKSKLESELSSIREELRRERLTRKFPRAAELFGPGDVLPSEERLAEIESKLASLTGGEGAAGRVDANNPMRNVGRSDEEERATLNAMFRSLFGLND
jgi:predicted nuclease with TOPRIM domain